MKMQMVQSLFSGGRERKKHWGAYSLCLVAAAYIFLGATGALAQEDTVPADHADSPQRTVFMQEPTLLPGEQELLAQIREARQNGEVEAASVLQAKLDAMYGLQPQVTTEKPLEIQEAQTPVPSLPLNINSDNQDELIPNTASAVANWSETDVLVTNLSYSEVNPSLTSSIGDGTLYVAVERLDTAGLAVYKSTDNGVSWTSAFTSFYVTGQELHNPSLAYVDTGMAQWLYIAFETVDTSTDARGVYVYRRNLGTGASNTFPVHTGITMAGASDHIYPRITSDNIDLLFPYVYLTYAAYDSGSYGVYFAKSTDLGQTWLAPSSITGTTFSSSSPIQPDIAYGTSGLFITFEHVNSGTNQVVVAKSINTGSSWAAAQLTTGTEEKYHPQVAVSYSYTESSPYILVTYTKEYSASNTDIVSYSSVNGGSTWTGPTTLPNSNANEESVALAASFNQGNFHAAYWHENDIWYTSAPVANPTNWSSPATLVNDTGQASSIYKRPVVAVNSAQSSDQEAAVVWTDVRNASNDAVYFGFPVPSATATTSSSFLPAIYLLLLFQ